MFLLPGRTSSWGVHAIGSARIFSLITDIRISKEEVLLDSRARYQGHMEIKSLKARKLGAKATDGMQNLGLTATSSLACLYTEPWSSLHCMTSTRSKWMPVDKLWPDYLWVGRLGKIISDITSECCEKGSHKYVLFESQKVLWATSAVKSCDSYHQYKLS